jgi:hypothetical protein
VSGKGPPPNATAAGAALPASGEAPLALTLASPGSTIRRQKCPTDQGDASKVPGAVRADSPQTRRSTAAPSTQSTTRRIVRWSLLLLLVGLVAGGIWLYRAISYVPEFYSAALAVAQPDLEQSNRDMLRRTAALTNDLKRVGEWRAIFTQQQINGWLAVDLPKNHPDLLPAELQNPRIRITPDRVSAAARYESNVSAVVSLEFAAILQGPNQVALRIHTLRIGDVPWRMDQIVEQATAAARQWGLQVEQTQTDGDPVLLLTLPPEAQQGREILLERLELRDGEVYLSGRTAPPQKR